MARDKALRVFEQIKEPVVVSDDNWIVPALNGFPGPYMKYINHTFTANDWLRLMKDVTDRRIILRQVIVYQDQQQQQVFATDVEATILREARGQSSYPHTAVISFDGGKTSAAEIISDGKSALYDANRPTSWHDLCKWLKKQSA